MGKDESKTENKRVRRIMLYDELNEIRPGAEPLPYTLIPILDDDENGENHAISEQAKGITFDCLVAQWRKITSFAFALQPISSFSKAVGNQPLHLIFAQI